MLECVGPQMTLRGTDDNFARNRNWEPILDRLIELRERENFQIKLILQVDTLKNRWLFRCGEGREKLFG
jgi:hypothetical protein